MEDRNMYFRTNSHNQFKAVSCTKSHPHCFSQPSLTFYVHRLNLSSLSFPAHGFIDILF